MLPTRTIPAPAKSRPASGRGGFTLVEVSIVLIVIGLLLGGVVAGNALMEAAVTRKAVGEIEELNSAVHAFQSKYRCLPGDCANAARYGFTQFSPAGTAITAGGAYDGDGNSIIHNHTALNLTLPGGAVGAHEVQHALWWMQEAGLIQGVNVYHSSTPNQGRVYFPSVYGGSFNGSPAMWSLTYYDVNDLEIGGVGYLPDVGHYYLLSADIPASGVITVLTAPQAYAFDSKIDDGLPLSGIARAASYNNWEILSWYVPYFSSNIPDYFGSPGSNSRYCLTNENPARYNVQNTQGYDPDLVHLYSACTMTVKAPF